MLNLNHRRLAVWQKAIRLVKAIYKATSKFPGHELYSLTSQLRRAAVSVPSNIAEGASRSSEIERRRFFEIARSSVVEIDTQMEIAKELGYEMMNEEEVSGLLNEAFALLSSMVK